ncbi:MAG: molybdopterin-dependent oxidoreductase [Smithellaceae bacterium]|nr:molybdopterin-dependent oxidoreductase [Smithellaceae bacterium]
MEQVRITINGSEFSSPVGTTVLQAAKQAEIDIPTLCDHPALAPIGACRICVVEVKGQRNLQTACSYPISEGMEIETESPRVVKARKLVLDMLFSERNHFCMFCEASGDCELQTLGYRYGLDHWLYPTYTKPFPIDATQKFFLMEHNRCILCQRCSRACGELVANHTLGLRQRGTDTMIHADTYLPWGESTCITCGTCLQSCPTGAIIERRSSFTGRSGQTEKTASTCSQCSIGCGIKVVTRGGQVLRIEGDWGAEVNGGLLCKRGRFDPLFEGRARYTEPLLRRDGKLSPADWDLILTTVAERINDARPDQVGILCSSSATSEALHLANNLFRRQLHSQAGLLNGAVPQAFDAGLLSDIEGSDIIIVAGADPVRAQPVSSFIVKRTADRGARLVLVAGKDNGLSPFAHVHVPPDEIGKAVEIASRAERPTVVYGDAVTDAQLNALKALEGKATFVRIEPGVNTYTAASLGINKGLNTRGLKVLYVLLGDQDWDGSGVIESLSPDVFIVLQGGFVSPLAGRADAVLPSAIWSERMGTTVNTDGRVLGLSAAFPPDGEAKQDWEVLQLLAGGLGLETGGSFAEISAAAVAELKGKEGR